MVKFRQRPVDVDAWQLPLPMAMQPLLLNHPLVELEYDRGWISKVIVHHAEGVESAGYGDWLVRIKSGEWYICNDQTFKQTYEKA